MNELIKVSITWLVWRSTKVRFKKSGLMTLEDFLKVLDFDFYRIETEQIADLFVTEGQATGQISLNIGNYYDLQLTASGLSELQNNQLKIRFHQYEEDQRLYGVSQLFIDDVACSKYVKGPEELATMKLFFQPMTPMMLRSDLETVLKLPTGEPLTHSEVIALYHWSSGTLFSNHQVCPKTIVKLPGVGKVLVSISTRGYYNPSEEKTYLGLEPAIINDGQKYDRLRVCGDELVLEVASTDEKDEIVKRRPWACFLVKTENGFAADTSILESEVAQLIKEYEGYNGTDYVSPAMAIEMFNFLVRHQMVLKKNLWCQLSLSDRDVLVELAMTKKEHFQFRQQADQPIIIVANPFFDGKKYYDRVTIRDNSLKIKPHKIQKFFEFQKDEKRGAKYTLKDSFFNPFKDPVFIYHHNRFKEIPYNDPTKHLYVLMRKDGHIRVVNVSVLLKSLAWSSQKIQIHKEMENKVDNRWILTKEPCITKAGIVVAVEPFEDERGNGIIYDRMLIGVPDYDQSVCMHPVPIKDLEKKDRQQPPTTVEAYKEYFKSEGSLGWHYPHALGPFYDEYHKRSRQLDREAIYI